MKTKLLRKIRKKYWIGKNVDDEFVIIDRDTKWVNVTKAPMSFCMQLHSLLDISSIIDLCEKHGERIKSRWAQEYRNKEFNRTISKIPHYK